MPTNRPPGEPADLPPATRDLARDAETQRLLAAGDQEGLQRLLTDHGGVVQAGLRRLLGRALADLDLEEAMNQAAMRIWQARTSFDPSLGTLRSWLFVIARNSALTLLARRRRTDTVSLDGLEALLPDLSATGSEADRLRLAIDIHRSLHRLPDLPRAVLTADLDAGEQAPATELAARLGISQRAVYDARARGRRLLRLLLRELGHQQQPARRPIPQPNPRPEPRFG